MTFEDVRNELRAIGKLCNPGGNSNILSVFGWGMLPDSPYCFIDMELCDFNLETYILREWEPSMEVTVPDFTNFEHLKPSHKLAQLLTIMRDIANGVAFIHLLDEIHRDLKPRNGTRLSTWLLTEFSVLYSHRCNNWKIADYSLTAEGDSNQERVTRQNRGTQGYRAPELVKSSDEIHVYTNKVDIWAMGCLFYEVIFLEKAFPTDIAVRKFCKSRGESLNFPLTAVSLQDIFKSVASRGFVSRVILDMLRIEPEERTAAREVLEKINTTRFSEFLT